MAQLKTRLDPVVRIEETREEKCLIELAAANRTVMAAEQALEQARARADHDGRRGAAADWDMAEQAHARAIAEVASAYRTLQEARTTADQTRARYLEVHSRAEAVRRLATNRREELQQERDKAERKEVEELQILRHRPRAA